MSARLHLSRRPAPGNPAQLSPPQFAAPRGEGQRASRSYVKSIAGTAGLLYGAKVLLTVAADSRRLQLPLLVLRGHLAFESLDPKPEKHSKACEAWSSLDLFVSEGATQSREEKMK